MDGLKLAIEIVTEMQKWRRGEGAYLCDEGYITEMPCTPREFGLAIDVLLYFAIEEVSRGADSEKS